MAQEFGNVSKARKMLGYHETRSIATRLRSAGGVEVLAEKPTQAQPEEPNGRATESAVVAFAIVDPAHGQVRASNELRK
jgi:hypothetical protein